MINIVASGLLSTIQDLGRFGYRNSGVPVSGAMDMESAILANDLLGNETNAPVIEFTATGPVLEFSREAVIVVTGALFGPLINDIIVPMNKPIRIEKGSRLSFSHPEKGVRGYLAIAGGFNSEIILGSASFYQGITSHVKLEKGSSLTYDHTAQRSSLRHSVKGNVREIDFEEESLKVYKGPEFGLLGMSIRKIVGSINFQINPQSNRMAYVLDHPGQFSAPEIITAPVQPGTVQLTPSGALHILMRDAQTTGGYARIFQLPEKAINKLAQKRAGSRVVFKIVDPPFDIPS